MLLLIAKASVVLAAGFGAAVALRRAPASSRHRVWSSAFLLVLALPLLAAIVPAVHIPVPQDRLSTLRRFGAAWNAAASSVATNASPNTPATASGRTAAPSAEPPAPVPSAAPRPAAPSIAPETSPGGWPFIQRFPWPFLLRQVWLCGAAAGLALLLLSMLRVRRLTTTGSVMTDEPWQRAAREISARLGLAAPPALIVSRRVSSPMAGGVRRPTVFLPEQARDWTAERRDVVLTHEIAHLAVRDPLRHLAARLVVCAYWFHPLAWLAAHRATVAREQACDEAVLAAGTRPSTYARVLLELADAGRPAAPVTALPMAQRSYLEKRLMTILNDSTTRPVPSPRWRVAVLTLAALTVGVAAARPSSAASAALAVVPFDGPIVRVNKTSVTIADRPSPVVDVQSRATDDIGEACDSRVAERAFNGTISTDDEGTRLMVGRSGGTEIVQRDFNGLRVCFRADAPNDPDDRRSWEDRIERPSDVIRHATSARLASAGDGKRIEMSITRDGGGARTTWRVNGQDRAGGAQADDWLKRMLDVLDNTWEISRIRGHISTLRGEISTIHGEESTLRGEISTVRGRVSTYQGEISTIRGQESTLRGEISTIQGHESALRGEISSEMGAISSLIAGRDDRSSEERRRIDARVSEHRKRIAELEDEIRAYNADGRVREIEKKIAAYNADEKVRAVRKDIDAFSADDQVRKIERSIEALNVAERVRKIEREIDDYDADRKIAALEGAQDGALKQLRSAIAAIR